MNKNMDGDAMIEIKIKGKSLSIKTFMPIWERDSMSNDGQIYIKIPLLGLETFGSDKEDIEKAIKEAIIAFCIVAVKYGKGIAKELEILGWKNEKPHLQTTNSILMNVQSKIPIFSSLLETGNKMAFNFQGSL